MLVLLSLILLLLVIHLLILRLYFHLAILLQSFNLTNSLLYKSPLHPLPTSLWTRSFPLRCALLTILLAPWWVLTFLVLFLLFLLFLLALAFWEIFCISCLHQLKLSIILLRSLGLGSGMIFLILLRLRISRFIYPLQCR